MAYPNTLYVSCLYDLYNLDISLEETDAWSISWLTKEFRYKHIEWLFSCDIDLILFTQEDHLNFLPPSTNRIRIIPYRLEDIPTYQKIINSNITLPLKRHEIKDTKKYFALMNSKLDFIQIARSWYPADRYTWIDASIAKLLKDKDSARSNINQRSLFDFNNLIASPSGLTNVFKHATKVEHPIWRFLGGVITIPDTKMDIFYNITQEILNELIQNGRISWEVNIWAEAEHRCPELFWLYGNSYFHDETMIQIPHKI